MSLTATSQRRLRKALATGVATCAVLPLLVATAHAAPTRTPQKPVKTYSASLQDAVGGRAVRTLDWRTPSVELRFDLSDAEIVSELSLTLSADPLPGVDPSLPITVQFNNGAPVELSTDGRGFDATVTLDPRRARARGNVLSLSHAVPCDVKTGGFTINLDESRLQVASRTRSRSLQLREVESRLGASAFAPASVGLIAQGSDASRLHMLGAQAIGLRMDTIPEFRTTTDATDFDIIMVPRHELHRYTTEDTILSRTGPRIELSREHSDRLFLTGDTDAEVLQSVQAFARHLLPRSRRAATSPGELSVQSPLDYARTRVDGVVRLDALSVTTASLREYTFDVPDPAAARGDLVLRLTRDESTAPGARLKAVLNGESLGEARLDGRRKTVSYPIKASQLRGSNNRLELTTKAAPNADTCHGAAPFIAIGAGSKLRLSATQPSPPTDLSRLAANGSVFAANAGADTDIVLPKDDAAFAGALRVVAKLGQATGQGWTLASVSRGDVSGNGTRHRLVIEPFHAIESDVAALAPRGLRSAWRGTPLQGHNRLASVERFAGLDAEDAVRMAARSLRASGDVGAGGVASVFPGEGNQLIAVVSNTPGVSFQAALEPLIGDAHWNGMSGSVSRWNGDAIVLAQTAIPLADDHQQNPPATSWSQRLAELDIAPPVPADMRWPEIDLPTLDAVSARVAAWWPDRTPKAEDGGAVFRPRFDTAQPNVPSGEPFKADAVPEPITSMVEVVAVDASQPAAQGASPTPQPAPVRSAPRLRGRIDLGARTRTTATRRTVSVRHWIRDTRRSVRTQLRRLEVKASRARADLRRRSGLRKPNVRGLRVGGYEIAPAMLLVVLASLLSVIGLGFVTATRRGSGHH